MPRYIDADKLVELYERSAEDDWNKRTAPSSWAEAFECAIADIDDQPTADVVEVVRCKECKYREDLHGRIMCRKSAHKSGDVWFGLRATAEYNFCSYGERKEQT